MKTLVIAAAALFGMLPGFHAAAMAVERITSVEGLQRMSGASVEEVLEVFTGDNYFVPLPGNPRSAALPSVSVVDKAGEVLAARMEKAREPLMKLLENGSPELRGRVLDLLAKGDLERMAALRPKVLPMLEDPSFKVRHSAVGLLAKVKDESVEIALLQMLGHRDPLKKDGGGEIYEVAWVIEVLFDKPVSEDRVIQTLIPWLDESKADPWVVRWIVWGTKSFSRAGAYSSQLMERYWAILNATRPASDLADYIAEVWGGDHPLSLPYLLRWREVGDEVARGCVAGALVEHRDFDVQKEPALVDALLKDPAAAVRMKVVSRLCERKDLSLLARLTEVLPFVEADPASEVRMSAARAVLVQFRGLPAAEADELLTDPSLGVADRMLAGLKDKESGYAIAIQTGVLNGGFDELAEGSDKEVITRAIAWWEDVKRGTVSRLKPKPSVPTPLNERPGWKDGVPPPPVK